jgi:hypothetical protein
LNLIAWSACIVALVSGCPRSTKTTGADPVAAPSPPRTDTSLRDDSGVLARTNVVRAGADAPSDGRQVVRASDLFALDAPSGRILGGIQGASLGKLSCPEGVHDVLDMVGRCDGGRTIANTPSAERPGARPPGDSADYGFPIALRGVAPATVRVRSNAVFSSDTLHNVLGEVPAGACVRATSMLKDAAVNGGIARAIRVRDSRGLVCRAYVSATMYQE